LIQKGYKIQSSDGGKGFWIDDEETCLERVHLCKKKLKNNIHCGMWNVPFTKRGTGPLVLQGTFVNKIN